MRPMQTEPRPLERYLARFRTVVALCATDRLLSKYKTYLDGVGSLGRRRAPILGIQTAIYMFMIYAAYPLAVWYGIHLYAKGEVKSSGNVITTPFSIIIGTNAFAQLAGYLGAFMRIFSAGSELLRVIQQDPVKLKNSSAATLHSDEGSEDDDKITFASVDLVILSVRVFLCSKASLLRYRLVKRRP